MANQNDKKPPLFEGAEWDKYKRYLVSREADRKTVDVNSLAHHNKGGYLGIYQMGVSALESAGYLKAGSTKLLPSKDKSGISQKEVMQNPENWTKGNSYESFIGSEEVQSKALKQYTKLNYKAIKGTLSKKGLDDSNDVYATLTTAHLGGAGNAKKLLNGERSDWTDGNGTKMQSYSNGYYSFAETPEDKIEAYKKNKARLDEIDNNDQYTEIEKADMSKSIFGEMSPTERKNFTEGRQLEIDQKKEKLERLNDTSTDEGFMLNVLRNNRTDFGIDGKGRSFEIELNSLTKEEEKRFNSILKSGKFNNIKLDVVRNQSMKEGFGSNTFYLRGSDISNVFDPIDQLALDATGESIFYNRYSENLDGDDPKKADPSRNFLKKKIKAKFYNSNITDDYDNQFEVGGIPKMPEKLPEDSYDEKYIDSAVNSYTTRNDDGGSSSSSSSSSTSGVNPKDEKGTVGDSKANAKGNGLEHDFIDSPLTRDMKKPSVFTDEMAQPSFGDFLKKNPNAPVSLALAVKGFIDAGKDVQSISVKDRTNLSEAFNSHFNLLEDMKSRGFTPAEESAYLKRINDGFNASVNQVVRASGGNRNLILANAKSLSGKRNDSLLDAAVADAKIRRENIKNFEDVLFYKEQFNERKDLRRQANEYRSKVAQRQEDLQTKASGAALAAGSIKGILDSVSTYQETGPGSIHYQFKEYMNASVRDKLTQVNTDTREAFKTEQEYIDYQKKKLEEDDQNVKNSTFVNDYFKEVAKTDYEKAKSQSESINRQSRDSQNELISIISKNIGNKDFDMGNTIQGFLQGNQGSGDLVEQTDPNWNNRSLEQPQQQTEETSPRSANPNEILNNFEGELPDWYDQEEMDGLTEAFKFI